MATFRSTDRRSAVNRILFRTIHIPALLLLALLLAATGKGSLAVASAAPLVATLGVVPETIAEGGTLYFAGDGFAAGRTYDLVFELGRDDLVVATATANARGTLITRATIPDLAPRVYTVEARYLGVAAAAATVTIVAGPQISVAPTSGAPGNLVDVSVTNLTAGQLQIDFDGVPVLGPLAVAGGVFNGSFVIPDTRQRDENTAVEVTAINALGASRFGVATTAFTLQPATRRSTYQFHDVELPQRPLGAGELIPITGRIDPPPDATLRATGNRLISAVYRAGGGGETIVLQTQSLVVDAAGNFEMNVYAPDLINGDGLIDTGSGAIGLIMAGVDAENRTTPLLVDTTDLYPVRPVTIRVRDQLNFPIENVLVRVRPLGKAGLITTPGDNSDPLGSGHRLFDSQDLFTAATTNQYQAAIEALVEGYNPLSSCGVGTFRGFTNAAGEFTFNVQKQAMIDHKLVIDSTGDIHTQTYTKQLFMVTVNALTQGYGTCNATGDPQLQFFYMIYDWYDDTFYQVETPTLPDGTPYDGTLAEFAQIDPNQLAIIDEIGPTPIITFVEPGLADSCNRLPATPGVQGVPGKLANLIPGSGADPTLPVFGDIYSFANSAGSDWESVLQSAAPLVVQFSYDVDLYGPFDTATLKIDGQSVGTLDPNITTCGEGDTVFSFVIPSGLTAYPATTNPHYYLGELEIEVLDPNAPGGVYEVYEPFLLRYVQPPRWPIDQDDKFTNISIVAAPWKVTIRADEYVEPSQVVSEDVGYGMGDVENSGESQAQVEQNLTPTGIAGIDYVNTRENEIINKETPAVDKQDTFSEAKTTVTYPPGNINLFDTGKIPLFRYGWGVWPIASATFGADFWMRADISQTGTITLDKNVGVPLASVTTEPEVKAGIEVFFDLSVLFGLVEAYVSALPTVVVETPVTLKNGVFQGPPLSGACFTFLLRVYFEISVGVWPLEVSVSDTIKLIDLNDGNACSARELAAIRAALEPVTFSDYPSAHPMLATDGLGETALIYVQDDGMLTMQWLNPLGENPPVELEQRPGLSKPLIAYYQPQRMVAIWAESSLDDGQIISATNNLDDDAVLRHVLQRQHIVYRKFSNKFYGPVLDLTSGITGGEGDLAIAACMSHVPECPSGGEVTAVWVRDMTGDLGQREFALYYSRFSGSSETWSTPLRVAPGSTAEDTQPSVTYVDGIPVVAWVRNPTRSLANLGARRIAYRFLALGTSAVVPAELPGAVASPSLTADSDGNLRLAFTVAEDVEVFLGNQRTLHTAKTTCSAATCGTWEVQKVVDKFLRDVRGERPRLLITPDGEALLTMRVLGFGNPPPHINPALIDDPQGVDFGTGVVGMVEAHFANVPHTFDFQSIESPGVHQVQTLYDPLLESVIVAHVEVLPPPVGDPIRSATVPERNPRTRAVAADQPVLLTTTPRQPDFKLLGVDAPRYPVAGETFSVTVQIVNEGKAWRAGAGPTVDLVATWNRGYRVGVPAGELTLSEIDNRGIISVTMPISPSVEFDRAQTLVLSINPRGTVAEYDRSDNVLTVAIGGLPTVGPLSIAENPGRSLIHLSWDAVDDPRVAGYRIYRADGGGPASGGRAAEEFVPVGTSLTNGFADVRAVLDATYTYAVTTYTAEGFESDLGMQVVAATASRGVPTANRAAAVETAATPASGAALIQIALLLGTLSLLIVARFLRAASRKVQ